MPLTLDEDDGYLTVEVPHRRPDGEPVTTTVSLDLYEANNKYAVLCDQFDPTDQSVELQQAWCDWLCEKGLPPLSHANGLRVLAKVIEEVAAFKKKHAPDSGTAESAAPSESPGSPAPSPN